MLPQPPPVYAVCANAAFSSFATCLRLSCASISVQGNDSVSPSSAPDNVTATMALVFRSTACSTLCAMCVRPSFILAILASGSCGCSQSWFDPFFGRFLSILDKSSRVGVPIPETLTGVRGDPEWDDNTGKMKVVSIRSPHRSKGRYVFHVDERSVVLFQSAPLIEARGDFSSSGTGSTGCCSFQSGPLTEARGDMSRPRGWQWVAGFQSAPLTEARGDDRAWRRKFQSAPLKARTNTPARSFAFLKRDLMCSVISGFVSISVSSFS